MLQAVLLVTEREVEGFAWKGLVPCESSLQVDSRSCVDGVECLKGRLPSDVDWTRTPGLESGSLLLFQELTSGITTFQCRCCGAAICKVTWQFEPLFDGAEYSCEECQGHLPDVTCSTNTASHSGHCQLPTRDLLDCSVSEGVVRHDCGCWLGTAQATMATLQLRTVVTPESDLLLWLFPAQEERDSSLVSSPLVALVRTDKWFLAFEARTGLRSASEPEKSHTLAEITLPVPIPILLQDGQHPAFKRSLWLTHALD